MTKRIHLFGCKGCGSAMAEAFLTLAGIEFDREEVNYDEPGPMKDRLLGDNPLAQVPTLTLPNGTVLTETLAIAHYVNALQPKAKLIPQRIEILPKFLRWSVFMVSALYPTWTYGDDPKKWIADEKAAPLLRESTDEHRKKLWRMVEAEAVSPYFLGDEFSAIDIYIKVMSHWRPRKDWFKEHCPKLFAINERVSNDSRLRKVWTDNFDE